MEALQLFAGDARFFWPENIEFFVRIPSAWDSSLNTGIGISSINTLWITSFLNFTAFFSNLGIPWFIINLIFWIIPTLLIAFLGAFFLFRKITSENPFYAILSGVIFTTNTYFLTVFFGGQQGVSFAYAFIPLVFLTFINLVRKSNFHTSIIFSLVLSLQLLFDPRFFLLTTLGLLLFYLFRFEFHKKHLPHLALIPFLTIFLLHSYWIVPLILFRPALLPQGFESVEGLRFFSFAFFENSLSLLHPNWPENIFGKVYFMRPEFLIIPILAFSSLLFIKNNKTIKQYSNIIPFFAFLALLSAFLAKGTNEPFGGIFIWLFENISGFSLFRDPTKFYSLVALSYSILIPYSLLKFSELSKKRIFAKIIVTSFIIFWVFSLRLLPVVDVLEIREIPKSYIQLKDFIVNKKHFFRTLWIPSWQRYGYFSDMNPAIGRSEIFREASASGMIRELVSEDALQKLQNLSVKYLIVPEDSEGEIFLEDRRYDERVYRNVISDISKISYLKKASFIGKIHVFEIPDPRDHFWSPSRDLELKYKFVNPTQYFVDVQNAREGDFLVFSEGFDRYWTAKNSARPASRSETGEFRIESLEFEKMNSFKLPKGGNYTLEINYEPQKWVSIGLIISGLTLEWLAIIFVRGYKK